MDLDLDLITKLENELRTLKQLEKEKKKLEEENALLEKTIKERIPFYSARLFDSCFNKNWSEGKIKKADKRMAIYCLTHAIEIRKSDDGTKSYPCTAWFDLGYL